MASRKVSGDSNMSILIPNDKVTCSSDSLDSVWIPTASLSFQGPKSIINFENACGGDVTDRTFFQTPDKEENADEDYDGLFHPPGKKRRLTIDQVQFLEKSFEVENKLEPDRKIQLANKIGLNPRQVAIWFQNRRARYKTKQLEKDYDSLKASYDKLKANCDNLQIEKEKLKDLVFSLQEKIRGNKDIEQLDAIDSPLVEEPDREAIPKPVFEHVADVPMLVVCKQEYVSSASSDVLDSDSTCYTEGNHSSQMEPADSSNVFEPEPGQSDFSQEEDDNLSKSLLPPPYFMKLEDDFYNDPPTSSFNFGYPVEDQPFCLWPY